VPVKFSLGGDRGLGILAADSPTSDDAGCNVTGPAVASTAANSGLQYDAASDTYTYVWKTPRSSPSNSPGRNGSRVRPRR